MIGKIGLEKATLSELGSKPNDDPVKGTEVKLQFNPESLKLTLHNANEGGKSSGRQSRQFAGKSSTQLSFDLIFDTAEEIKGGKPRSVTDRTREVERFVRPKGSKKKKQAPPRVRFHWGILIFDGIISDLSIEFELFSPHGIPLRAKMSVTIKEQDPKYQYLKVGSGANQTTNGTDDGGGALGTETDRAEAALAGESLADFAARMGLAVEQWRQLARDIEDPLSLAAGQIIEFDSALTSAEPLGGVRSALESGTDLSVDETLGIAAGMPGRAAGVATAAVGGVQSALATAAIIVADQKVAEAREAFSAPVMRSVPPPAAVTAVSLTANPSEPQGSVGAARPISAGPRSTRTPLAGQMHRVRTTKTPAAARPAVDRRATSFGAGVPLRPQIRGAATDRADAMIGQATLGPIRTTDAQLRPGQPSDPPWEQLPMTDLGRAKADGEDTKRKSPALCTCTSGRRGGRCTCRST